MAQAEATTNTNVVRLPRRPLTPRPVMARSPEALILAEILKTLPYKQRLKIATALDDLYEAAPKDDTVYAASAFADRYAAGDRR